tara:strand:- start:821 stop:2464 length:1644 start_codon:yes stop_codon:yes gene_type:complete
MTQKTKVLALKYRPQTFEELIGQEVITETIFNSIKSDKSPNAYLFTGIRGVGKTTFARIVAKALNCENGIEKLCKERFCKNCEPIMNSNHIDVLEMDAASKTGVDDVRDLIEFSRYPPSTAKFKIFIIDEVHMLSKQAFNALLKTLEEPPNYLKFIFATTEIKKIPITVVSRCQRFDLSRVSSEKLLDYLKKILNKENGKATEDALKLIVKISEGSVRDALSLLDRGLMLNIDNEELNLKKANDIYGYFDKSLLIDLFEDVLKGNESSVIEKYRKIYNAGVEPKVFLNDFLEILYYLKNSSKIQADGTGFLLNDEEFNKINEISKSLNVNDLILFWNFAIKFMNELDIVSNQNISIEMFLIRLMYLKGLSEKPLNQIKEEQTKINEKNDLVSKNPNTINQIKNIEQKEINIPKTKPINSNKNFEINSFDELLALCNKKKEVKLKFELEHHVNLVSFSNKRIEIAFNENLDKNFVKNLTEKLLEWTDHRWIISLSQKKGTISRKQLEKDIKNNLLETTRNSDFYKKVLDIFPDAELEDIMSKEEETND